VTDVLAEREAAHANNGMYERATAAEMRLLDDIDALEEKLREKMGDLALLQSAAVQLDQPVDLNAFDERLANIEATNARVRAQQHRAAIAAELSDRKEQAAKHTLALKAIEKQKADALAAVTFPVPGLSFDDTRVTYNGIPFSQASPAEQLRVSVALAMAANPTLRVLRILDGSLLDSKSLETIADLAEENDYQVWIEVVDETGAVGHRHSPSRQRRRIRHRPGHVAPRTRPPAHLGPLLGRHQRVPRVRVGPEGRRAR
jgi:hypothetical protein